VNGLRLIYRSSRNEVFLKSLQSLVGGISLFTITALAAYSSVVYNFAISRSNLHLLFNTVVLLFVNELDENLHKSLQALCPKWMEKIHNQIIHNFSKQEERSIPNSERLGQENEVDRREEDQTKNTDILEWKNKVENRLEELEKLVKQFQAKKEEIH